MRTSKFKMTEVGPIPEDWEVKQLGDLFELSAAGDLQSECSSRVKTNINIHPIYSNGLENAGLYGYTSKPRYRANSITITGRGTLGHAEYRTVDFDAIIRLIVMNPSAMLDGRYVVFQINYRNPFHFEITSIPQLTVPQVAQALIPIPPLAEQEKIAEALSDVDALLSAMSTLIEKKRNIKTGAMQDLLGMRNEECGMRNVPRRRLAGFSGEWVEKRLGECGDFIGGGTPSTTIQSYWNGGIDWYTPAEIGVTKYVSKSNRRISLEGLNNSAARLLPVGTILLTTRATIGLRAILQHEAATNQGFQSLVVAEGFDSEFMYYLLLTAVDEMVGRASGSTFLEISAQKLKEISVVLPPTLAEQKAIAAVLSDMDAEIAALEAKRAKYESIKQGMMQELLTGKTRLKGE